MARIDTRLSLSAPSEINISLVRADYLVTCNIFRTIFEVFLSVWSAVVGVILSVQKISALHWVFFGVMLVSAVVFLFLSVWFGCRARSG